MPRTLRIIRSSPGPASDWSGSATTEGLHTAAPSTAYSAVT